MTYMGASVFHDEAILPVREVAIPIVSKTPIAREIPHFNHQDAQCRDHRRR